MARLLGGHSNRAARIMGLLNVAGVDLLRSERGPVVMEVNSSPGLEGIEAATGKDVAGTVTQLRNQHYQPDLGGSRVRLPLVHEGDALFHIASTEQTEVVVRSSISNLAISSFESHPSPLQSWTGSSSWMACRREPIRISRLFYSGPPQELTEFARGVLSENGSLILVLD